MANPYQAPAPDSATTFPSIASETSTRRSAVGFWYFLLIPASLLYTFAAREIAGPGYTTAPNQGAMVVFFVASLAWPIVAIVFMAVIRSMAKVRGVSASICGLLSLIASSIVPFLVGMK